MRNWLLVLIAACGSDNGSLTFEQYAAQAESAYCNYLARCGLFPDAATCESAQNGVSFTNSQSAADAIGSGKITFFGDNAAACLAAISNASCDSTMTRTTPAACYGIAAGTVGSGGMCAVSEECISQECDVPSCGSACCQGTCIGNTPPMPAATGMPCAFGASTTPCVAGDFCDFQSETCEPYVAAGSACMESSDCAPGLGCVGTPETCKALPGTGSACLDEVCANIGEHCGSAGTCVKDGLPGDTCTTNADCSPYFPCDASGHCAKGPGLGQSCNSGTCFDAGTYCTDETGSAMPICAAQGSDGAPCTASDQCVSGVCAGSACVEPTVCF